MVQGFGFKVKECSHSYHTTVGFLVGSGSLRGFKDVIVEYSVAWSSVVWYDMA